MDRKNPEQLSVEQVDALLDALEERIADLLAVSPGATLPGTARAEAAALCEAAAAGFPVCLGEASQEALVYLLGLIQRFAIEMERGTVSRTVGSCGEPALALLAFVLPLDPRDSGR